MTTWDSQCIDSQEPVILQACRQATISKESLTVLLEQGNDVNATSKAGTTALHVVCFKKNYGIAKFLISHNANVNARDFHFNYTPLHIVIKYAFDIRLVELLIENKADLTIKDESGATCLNLACETLQVDVVRLILSANSSNINVGRFFTPLATACESGNVDICRLLLEHKADPHKTCEHLPIHYAVSNPKTFELLLQATDINEIKKYYKSHSVFGSFPIYLLFFLHKTECFDIFMRTVKDTSVKLMTAADFFSCQVLLELIQYRSSSVVSSFIHCYRYYLYLEPIDFFFYLKNIVTDDESFFLYLRFIELLLKMGVPTGSKCILQFKTRIAQQANKAYKKLAPHDPRKIVADNVRTALKEHVLSLKQLSRTVLRSYLAKKFADPWLCYDVVNGVSPGGED